ncbi:MAG: hypothetical protein ACREKL_00535 [Chthoniobacterales bacterium]
MKTLLVAASIVLGATSLLANPVAIDSSRRPVTMTTEKVLITVSPGRSEVQGTYTFRQEKDDWPAEADTHVIIFVPVFESRRSDIPPASPPVITVGGKKFTGRFRDDIALDGTPCSSVKLPKGWHMAIYEASVPLELIAQTFTIAVSYTQPHFEGDISGYVPIDPPKSKGASVVTFRAAPGYALERVGARLFGQPSFPAIEFTPQDRQLIRVRCVKPRGQAPASR